MRSVLSALLLLLTACGNLSNEDVAFLEAIPHKGAFDVQVPRGDTAQTACSVGTADVWNGARTTGDQVNNLLNGILALVDGIRSMSPTVRQVDCRVWGPFPDRNHPGVRFKVEICRELDAKGVPWRWIYTFAASKNGAPFLPVLTGEFFGALSISSTGRSSTYCTRIKSSAPIACSSVSATITPIGWPL